MRSLLVILLVFALLPLNASKIVIQPGRSSVSDTHFAFHSRDRLLYIDHGPISYGRLDTSPFSHLMENPHGSRYSLDLDAIDSTVRGVRGMMFDSDFLDFTIGLDGSPAFSMVASYGNMDLGFDLRHVNAHPRKILSSWERALDRNLVTFGFEASGEYGLHVISIFSLSPSAMTKVFTGMSMDTGNLEVEIGRGNTLASTRDVESSYRLKGKNKHGFVYFSDRTGNASCRPSSYTETERELGYGFKMGKGEIGCSVKVYFSREGKWRRKVSRYLDLGFAKFTFSDGSMRFSMKPVDGFSIGISGRNSSISFKYKGLEIKRYYNGSWRFSLSIEPT